MQSFFFFFFIAIVRASKTSTRRRDLYYLGSVAANKYCSFHSLIVKNFPMCPLQCGCQPTNQRHSATRQRGSDANLGATGNHYWHQAHCLPFFSPLLALDKQNGGSCSNGNTAYALHWIKYHQKILWIEMRFIPNDRHSPMTDRRGKKQKKKKKEKEKAVLSRETTFILFSRSGLPKTLGWRGEWTWCTRQAEYHRSVLWLRITLMLNIDHSLYFPFSSFISVKRAALRPMSSPFFYFIFFFFIKHKGIGEREWMGGQDAEFWGRWVKSRIRWSQSTS